jgi:hypothetical protein
MHGRTPKVCHFHVFGCICFIIKKGKNLNKFDARSVDGIFFGYATHSRAFHLLNLETNQIVETCKVTFDETQARSSLVFDCARDDELGEEIFQEEEHEHGHGEDGGVVLAAEHVPTTSTTMENRPSPAPTTMLTDKRRIPLRSASVRTRHLFHHGIPKVLVNPRKGITSVQSTFTL